MINSTRAQLLAALVPAALVAACSADRVVSPSPANGQPANPPEVAVLGDSLAVSPSSSDNFVVRLQERIDASGYRWRVVNASASGALTADGVRRADAALGTRTRILVLELGANDGLRGVAAATIEQNLATIIERARSLDVRVLLCGMETPPTHGLDYTVDFHRIFPRLSSRYGIPLVPFLLSGVVLDPSMNGPDGIHPNSSGARRIAETVWPYLERMLAAEITVRYFFPAVTPAVV